MNISKAINDFLFDVSCFKSKDTYRFYQSHFNCILNYFQSINVNVIDDINSNSIKKYIIYLRSKDISNNTINKRILCIRLLLKSIKRFDILDELDSIPKLKISKKTFQYLTFNQVTKFLDYISNSNISLESKLIFRLLLDTGIRLNELVNIKVPNIDLANNCILIDVSKTHNERYVFFTNDTKDNYLVPFLKTCYNFNLISLSKSGISSLFFRANLKLNFQHFSPHMLRHTYATILINNNTNLEFIRQTLGHSSLDTTKRYLHLNQESLFATYTNQFNLKGGA